MAEIIQPEPIQYIEVNRDPIPPEMSRLIRDLQIKERDFMPIAQDIAARLRRQDPEGNADPYDPEVLYFSLLELYRYVDEGNFACVVHDVVDSGIKTLWTPYAGSSNKFMSQAVEILSKDKNRPITLTPELNDPEIQKYAFIDDWIIKADKLISFLYKFSLNTKLHPEAELHIFTIAITRFAIDRITAQFGRYKKIVFHTGFILQTAGDLVKGDPIGEEILDALKIQKHSTVPISPYKVVDTVSATALLPMTRREALGARLLPYRDGTYPDPKDFIKKFTFND